LKRGRQRFGDLALRWGEPAEQEGNSDHAHTRDPAGASRRGHQVKMDRLRTLFTEPVLDTVSIPYLTPDRAYEVIGMTPAELFVVWHLNHGRIESRTLWLT
jgi:hypothetical protein